MSTIVASLDVSVTESRSRRPLMDMRSSHSNVLSYNRVSVELAVGDSRLFVCERFAYLHIRDVLDLTITTLTGNIKFTGVSGSFTFPIKCNVTLAVPGSSTLLLARKVDLVYG